MKVWIFSPYDKVPGESWGYERVLSQVEMLLAEGHDVTFWTSNYSHSYKRFRADAWEERKPQPGFRIVFVPCRAYIKHVGFARLFSLLDFAWHLCFRARREERPDCLVLPLPAPFLELAAVGLARHFRAKLVCDLRDLWPELFLTVFPKWAAWFGKVAISPFYLTRWLAVRHSDGLVAVTPSYMTLLGKIHGKPSTVPTSVVYCGIDNRPVVEACSVRVQPGTTLRSSPVRVIYTGTLGNNYDIETLIAATRKVRASQSETRILFTITGAGPLSGVVQQAIREGADNIEFLGVVNDEKLLEIYAQADVALCTYASFSTVAIPGKAFMYMAAALPMVNSLEGEFAEFLEREQLGINYKAGDAGSLAQAILELANDAARRERMTRRLQEIAGQFDKRVQYGNFAKLVTKVCRSGGSQ